MLLSWKTCHGANTLHREGVCKCAFLCLSLFPLHPTVSQCECVSVLRERICAIIRPVRCQNLFAYTGGKKAGIPSSQSVQIFMFMQKYSTIRHTHGHLH